MGGSSSQSAEVIAASDAGGLERVQYIEHRRRSSLINMEETMMSRKMDHQAPAAGIKVVSKASFRGKPPNVTCTIRFSPEAELFTRPRTTRQDKPTLHYNSTDFAMMQNDAADEDEAFMIVDAKTQNGVLWYGIQWMDDENEMAPPEWITREAVYVAGPLMLCEYESLHHEELVAMNTRLEKMLNASGSEAKIAQQIKQDKERVISGINENSNNDTDHQQLVTTENIDRKPLKTNETSPAAPTKERPPTPPWAEHAHNHSWQ